MITIMKKRFSKATLFILLPLILVCYSENNSANGQVIPGTKDITVERCNWIFDRIPDHFAQYDSTAFSKEFAGLMDDYFNLDNYPLGNLLGAIDDDEFMAYWYCGNGECFSQKVQKSYYFVEGTERKAKIRLHLDEIFYDDNGKKEMELHGQYHMVLSKENGLWKLDDWINEFGHSRKAELRDYVNDEKSSNYVRYRGHMLDDDEPKPFVAVLRFAKEKASGEREISGAFRFNDKKNDPYGFYDYLDGSLKQGGSISFTVSEYDRESGFYGTITPDLSRITGDWQAYNPDGKIAYDREFVMEIWPKEDKLTEAVRGILSRNSSPAQKIDLQILKTSYNEYEAEQLKKRFLSVYGLEGTLTGSVFSPEFDRLLEEADSVCAAEGAEIGFFEYDLILQAQEYVPITSIKSEVDGDRGKITTKRVDDSVVEYTYIRIEGKWYIDDIKSTKFELSAREEMEKFFREMKLNEIGKVIRPE